MLTKWFQAWLLGRALAFLRLSPQSPLSLHGRRLPYRRVCGTIGVGRSFVQARATPCYLCCLLIVACSIVPLQPVVESQTLTGADGRPGWRSLWLRPPHGVAELTKKTGPRCATIETALTLSGRWRPIDLRYADTPTDATTPLSIHHRHNFRTPSNNKTDHPPHSLSNETPHFTTE